jgi:ferredoxin
MPKVEINDEVMEATLGERLLNVARRNAAHIGFGCDGNGLCTMCECRILSGADQLNPPTEAERTWLPPSRLAEGYRLGCQSSLRGNGTVRALTRAEELRRQLNGVFNPAPGSDSADSLSQFLGNFAAVNWQHIRGWPFNWLSTFNRIGPAKFLWPFDDLGQFTDDTVRITRRMVNGGRALEAPQPAPVLPPEEA